MRWCECAPWARRDRALARHWTGSASRGRLACAVPLGRGGRAEARERRAGGGREANSTAEIAPRRAQVSRAAPADEGTEVDGQLILAGRRRGGREGVAGGPKARASVRTDGVHRSASARGRHGPGPARAPWPGGAAALLTTLEQAPRDASRGGGRAATSSADFRAAPASGAWGASSGVGRTGRSRGSCGRVRGPES